jgi:hypothetical protein
MAKVNDTIYCDGCGVEILCQPFTLGGRIFCCEDCANGLPCRCGEHMEEEERRSPNPAMPG